MPRPIKPAGAPSPGVYLRQLESCGIRLNPGTRLTSWPDPGNAKGSEPDRYLSLLLTLGGEDESDKLLSDQVLNLDTECVGFPSAYQDVVQDFVRLTLAAAHGLTESQNAEKENRGAKSDGSRTPNTSLLDGGGCALGATSPAGAWEWHSSERIDSVASGRHGWYPQRAWP